MRQQDTGQYGLRSTTLITSYTPSAQTSSQRSEMFSTAPGGASSYLTSQSQMQGGMGSTARGILIGLGSALGSSIFVILVILVIYFFRFTQQGRIFLDRMGRPGEYDDEQAFAKEEAEALEEMDDIQAAEYLRAKGMD